VRIASGALALGEHTAMKTVAQPSERAGSDAYPGAVSLFHGAANANRPNTTRASRPRAVTRSTPVIVPSTTSGSSVMRRRFPGR